MEKEKRRKKRWWQRWGEGRGARVGWEERLPGLSFYGEGRSRGGDGSGVGNAGVGDVLEARGCVEGG